MIDEIKLLSTTLQFCHTKVFLVSMFSHQVQRASNCLHQSFNFCVYNTLDFLSCGGIIPGSADMLLLVSSRTKAGFHFKMNPERRKNQSRISISTPKNLLSQCKIKTCPKTSSIDPGAEHFLRFSMEAPFFSYSRGKFAKLCNALQDGTIVFWEHWSVYGAERTESMSVLVYITLPESYSGKPLFSAIKT